MVSGSITLWPIDGEKVSTVTDFIFLGSKITADSDWYHEIKRHLLLGRKAMTNLDSIFKSRDITLLTKVFIVKAMAFPVVMYGYESWTIKKAEHWKIDAFELWCWRRLLRVPWTAKRSNQSILKEINLKYSYSEYSLEGLMLKLNLQYLGHMMRGANPLEMTLMLGNIEGKWRMGWQRMRWLDDITDSMDMSLSKLLNRKAWSTAVHGVTKSQTTQQRDLTRQTSFLRMQPGLTLPLPPPASVPVAAASVPSPALVPSVCVSLPCWVYPFPFMLQNLNHTLPRCNVCTSLILQSLIGHLTHDYNPQRGINSQAFWWKVEKTVMEDYKRLTIIFKNYKMKDSFPRIDSWNVLGFLN